MISNPIFTAHSLERMKERNILKTDVFVCLNFGTVLYEKFSKMYILTKKNIAKRNLIFSLTGLCVIVDGNTVITTYKNRTVLKKLEEKDIQPAWR